MGEGLQTEKYIFGAPDWLKLEGNCDLIEIMFKGWLKQFFFVKHLGPPLSCSWFAPVKRAATVACPDRNSYIESSYLIYYSSD